ncbi:MAG: hypothetical protein PHG85_06625 [Candidatus Altiarchaeota archaeon]|nr:hypothetical protein [Candidatus Altiarchaeota archaeon]
MHTNRRAAAFFIAACLLLFLALEACAAPWPTDYAGMRTKAIHFAGRLVCLVDSASAYVILIFIAIGGVKYLMADDPSEAMMARKMVFDGVVGGFLVLLFVAVAEAVEVPMYC